MTIAHLMIFFNFPAYNAMMSRQLTMELAKGAYNYGGKLFAR